MPTVNPKTHIARTDEDARFRDVEVTGDFYLGDDATITGDFAITGTLGVTGVLTASGGLKLPGQVIAGDGAITIKSGVVMLTKGSAAAITLAAPTAATDDYKVLHIVAGSAQAHVVTVTGMAAGAGQDVGTFGGAINDSTSLVAYNGGWYVLNAPRNVTWA